MADTVSKEKRSWIMSKVGVKHTKPEREVRSALHRAGFRYRLHVKDLPGSPDIVLTKYKTVIFVNGCFWHRHEGCRLTTTPKSKIEFWENKFQQNVERDAKNYQLLKDGGWNVIILWECELRKKRIEDTIRILTDTIRSDIKSYQSTP